MTENAQTYKTKIRIPSLNDINRKCEIYSTVIKQNRPL